MFVVKERYYVGRGMYEKTTDFIKYSLISVDSCFFFIFWNYICTEH